MIWAQFDFLPGNIYNHVFADKKTWNSKTFFHMGFGGPKASTKFWDFAAGMELDT